MSIARTTPAQNPRGFNSSKVLVSDKSYPPPTQGTLSLLKDALRVSKDTLLGQCKPLRVRGLAVGGENWGANGRGLRVRTDSCHRKWQATFCSQDFRRNARYSARWCRNPANALK